MKIFWIFVKYSKFSYRAYKIRKNIFRAEMSKTTRRVKWVRPFLQWIGLSSWNTMAKYFPCPFTCHFECSFWQISLIYFFSINFSIFCDFSFPVSWILLQTIKTGPFYWFNGNQIVNASPLMVPGVRSTCVATGPPYHLFVLYLCL